MTAKRQHRLDLSEWPTKPEVAQILGKSEKTIQRWANEGKLRVEYRSVPGRKPLPVYDPRYVQRAKEEADAGEQVLQRAEGAMEVNERDKAMGGPLQVGKAVGAALAQQLGPMLTDGVGSSPAIAQALQAIADGQRVMAEIFCRALDRVSAPPEPPKLIEAPAPPPVPVTAKLTLTLTEATAFSGLDMKQLKHRIKTCELRNLGTRRDPRIPRSDLEALVARPPEAAKEQAAL